MSRYLQFPILASFSQLSHFLTTRHFPLDITTPRGQKYFLHHFSSSQSTLILPQQVHGSKIQVINKNQPLSKNKPKSSDAILTNQTNIWIGIVVADCFPILYFDPKRNVVAVIHAGWRGISQNIHLNTLQDMTTKMNSNIKDIRIGIGPGIGSCCFEVGNEVSEIFKKRSITSSQFIQHLPNQKDTIDLREILTSELEEAGVPLENIEHINYCTSCHSELWYSFRKEGKDTGRMLLAACLNKIPGKIQYQI